MKRIIDRKVEKQLRDMLEFAIRGDLEDLAALIRSVGDAAYKEAIGLCLVAAAYVAVDVSTRWPTDADLREIARLTAERETETALEQGDIYNFLAKSALGYEPLEDALGTIEAAATLPVLITGSLLFIFRPKGKDWWEYLDQIWNATLTAENLDESVVPAVQIRAHRTQVLKARDAAK